MRAILAKIGCRSDGKRISPRADLYTMTNDDKSLRIKNSVSFRLPHKKSRNSNLTTSQTLVNKPLFYVPDGNIMVTLSNIMEHNSSQLGQKGHIEMFPEVTYGPEIFLHRTYMGFLLNQAYRYETTLKHGGKYVCL